MGERGSRTRRRVRDQPQTRVEGDAAERDVHARARQGADFGVQDSIDALLAKVQGAVDQGFPRIKLKFRPGWDLDMVAAVRAAFPCVTFHVDCNAAYTLADADLFKRLDRYHLAMI